MTAKKIVIDKTEQIELSEREQQIYRSGYQNGIWLGGAVAIGFVIVLILILAVNHIEFRKY